MPDLLENRLICFLDILGFSDALRTQPIVDLHKRYAELIDYANSKIFVQKNLVTDNEPYVRNFARSQFLFDSIVLVSHETIDPKNVCKFILASLDLIKNSFINGFFLRGSLTLGDIVYDEERNIFLSKIFPDLLAAEKDQEWCGCTIEKLAEQLVIESLYGNVNLEDCSKAVSSTHPIVPYIVDRKNSEKETSYWCLNWIPLCDPMDIDDNLQKLIEPKQSNTRRFINWVSNLPSSRQDLPIAFGSAKYFETIKTRGGFIILFRNEKGNLVELPDGFSFNVDFSGVS